MNWLKFFTLSAVLLSAAALFADEATDQYNAAKSAFDNKQFDSAGTGFNAFLTKYPTHIQASAATFYLAESLMFLRQYAQAEVYFSRLVALGLNDPQNGQYARAALFRLAEIPYLQGQFDIAKPRLEDFVDKLSLDVNLQFVLYYLGDIAMRSSASHAAAEAEHYFGLSERMFPEGAKALESKLGLAWAKNKLGKVTEANEIYAQLMNSTNPAVAEQAYYQYGTALFDRGAFQDAINSLTDFQRRYSGSTYLNDSRRVIARCQGRLNNYEEALQTLALIAQPTPEDLLLKVRFLYGVKRMDEAKNVLEEAKRMAGAALYRDEIALLESVFLSDKKDWGGAIALLESVLMPQFDANNNKMVVSYLSSSLGSGTKKLSEENFFRTCSLLAAAYANNRQSDKANALLNEMQAQAALSGNLRLTNICMDTANQLANIGTSPNRGGGSYAGRNEQQWNPNSQGTPQRTLTVQTTGTHLDQFWNADRLYRAKNYEAAAQQLEQIISGFYNQIVTPKQYNIFYNVTGAVGTLDENTFAKACSMLVLAKAQSGDFEQANAVLSTFASRIRMGDTVQQKLLQDTYDELAVLAKGGVMTGSSSSLSDLEQRRLLRDANSLVRQKRYDQADAKLTELVSANPPEVMLTEALLLHSKAKFKLGREQESVKILERIEGEFPLSKEYPDALWYLGLYHESGGDSYQAVEYFQMLADQFPNFQHIDGALYFLAVDDLTNGSGRTAMTNLTRIHRNHRNGLYWSHAAWMLAYEAYKKKRYTEAEGYVQEILRNLPDVVILDRVLYLKGELALRQEDFPTAFLAFKGVNNLCPESPLCRYATLNTQLAASKMVNVQ